ncbi:TPA: restriction endonuclease subunit S [Klebsiella pneumoniae]
MSELSYLEKMLDGVEVEWRNLGDTSLFEIANNGRKPVKASLRIAGETPYYGANNIQDYVDGYTHDGEYVLIAEDGSASLENYSIQYATGKFWANNHVHVVRGKERVHSRFLYHYLCIVNFLPFLTGGGRAKLTKGQLIEIPVPIPCPNNPEKSLAIQSEIVRILDKFTALTAELTAELTARKKQYNYYRDQLLSFDEEQEKPIYLEKLLDGVEVEWLPLGVLGELVRGNGLPKTDFTEAGIPAIHYGQIYTFYGLSTETTKSFVSQDTAKKLKKVNTGDVVITNTSENLDDVGKALVYLGKEQAVTGGHATIFKPNKGIIGKYFAYFTQTNSFFNEKRKHSKGTKVIDVSASDMAKITIPIPCPNNPEKSLAIQSAIVRILDKFDTLTNSISEGLPREIELRQKQYEYYRDLLFSFPKPDSVTN